MGRLFRSSCIFRARVFFKARIDDDKLFHSPINWWRSGGKRSSSFSLVFFKFHQEPWPCCGFFLGRFAMIYLLLFVRWRKEKEREQWIMMSRLSLFESLEVRRISCRERGCHGALVPIPMTGCRYRGWQVRFLLQLDRTIWSPDRLILVKQASTLRLGASPYGVYEEGVHRRKHAGALLLFLKSGALP